MSKTKDALRKVMPLRTSTYMINHDADVREAFALHEDVAAVHKKVDDTAKALKSDVKSVDSDVRSSKKEILSALRELSRQIEGLEREQRLLRQEIMRNQWLIKDLLRNENEYLDPKLYAHALCEWYHRVTGQVLDLSQPRTFNEKIQWSKLYDHDSRRSLLADKIAVRDYVKERVGEGLLVPLLGFWRRPDEIDFDSLPNSFVLKANHGCGYNAIVRDKSSEDLNQLRYKARMWMREEYAFRNGFELQYAKIQRKLFAEDYLENLDGDMPDYKFWCFDGKVHFIQYLSNRSTQLTMTFLDTDWNVMPFVYDYPRHNHVIERPKQLTDMISIAQCLAEGFPHVRVDLYLLDDGTIKFGELTFTSASGGCKWDPPETDLMLGNLYHLPIDNA